MNKTEEAYAAHLFFRQERGEVAWWSFDAVNFRLADKTFYRPDFLVMLAGGDLEVHEVKGHWEDDARVKIKVAADRFPLRFIAAKPRAKRDGGGWTFEEF